MPRLPDFMDAEAPGSRFASRPGLVVLTGADQSREHHDGDRGDAAATIASAFGDASPKVDGLGDPEIIDGSIGRGASGWVTVLEWAAVTAGGTYIGLGTRKVNEAVVRGYRSVLERLRSRDVGFLINRAGAALVALAWVLEQEIGREFEVEAAEEFAFVAGREATEPNPVGVEPWLVTLVDTARTVRYILVIGTDGIVKAGVAVPLEEFEGMYLPPLAED